MSRFKKGDRVRCLADYEPGRQFTCGNEYVVREDCGPDCSVVADDKGRPNGWYGRYFVPVAEATGTDVQADKPKFKVGDRVRLIRSGGYNGYGDYGKTGECGEVVKYTAYDDQYEVNFEDSGRWWAESVNLEPVAVAQQPQPLRIQPGKFYITRDGRKVGPMRRWSEEAIHCWEADDDDLPYIWADDGTEIDSDIDDGADLVAEASSSDNGSTVGSTAGFTVPLCAYEDEPGWYVTELGRAYADGYAAGLQAGSEEVSDKASAAHCFRDDVDRVVLDCLKRFKQRGLLDA